jgi:hypothetical protein
MLLLFVRKLHIGESMKAQKYANKINTNNGLLLRRYYMVTLIFILFHRNFFWLFTM